MNKKAVIFCNRRTGSNLLKDILDNHYGSKHHINEFFNLKYDVKYKNNLLYQTKNKQRKINEISTNESNEIIEQRIKFLKYIQSPIVLKVIVEHNTNHKIYDFFKNNQSWDIFFLERKDKLEQFLSLCIMNFSKQAYVVNNGIDMMNNPTDNDQELALKEISPVTIHKDLYHSFLNDVKIFNKIKSDFNNREIVKLYYEDLRENMYNFNFKTRLLKLRNKEEKLSLCKNIKEVESWFKDVCIK